MKTMLVIKEDKSMGCGLSGFVECDLSRNCPASGGEKKDSKFCKKCFCLECIRAFCKPAIPEGWVIKGEKNAPV